MKIIIFGIIFILFIGFILKIFSKNNIEIDEEYIDYLIMMDFFEDEENK